MTDSRRDPAPRTARALPSWWQLVAAAIVAFLLYSIWAPVADRLGFRSRPEPALSQVTGAAAVESLPAIEARLIAALRELAAGADDARRQQAEKLLQDYLRVRWAAEAEVKKKSGEESEVAKSERKQKEEDANYRAWSKVDSMLHDRLVANGAIVNHLEKNLPALTESAVDTAVRRFIDRTRVQSGAEREMALLAGEIGTHILGLPRVAAAGGSLDKARADIRRRIEAYYAARRQLGVRLDRSGERELESIALMPFESGARVMLRNLAKSDMGPW
jgi:hypothetical protein